MKRINLLGTALLTIVVMTSCGSSKPVTQTVQQPAVQQDVEINVPCSGPEFQTNKEYFRASSMGLSTDMSIAKKKAMTEARAEIATAINAKVKSVTDSYVSSYQQGENDESKSRYQSLTRTVVEQELSGTRKKKKKTMKTPGGKYKVYVSLELAGEEIMNAMANRIKNDDKLRIDFEYEKFKKVFEEEMSKNAQ